MLINFVAAGGTPEQFWRSTPREVALLMRAYARRVEQEQDGRAWLAWHVAALSRIDRLPPLDRMFSGRPRRMTDAELNAIGRDLWISRGGDPAEWDRETARVAQRRADEALLEKHGIIPSRAG